MVISNYVYEKAGKRHKTVTRYSDVLPENRIFTWDEAKRFRLGQYLLMHALIYRLDIIKKCNLRVPEKMFYVDNYFSYVPLDYVCTMYYVNVDFYRYFIGRDGQSIHEKTMIRRIDQQLAVNRMIIEAIDLRTVDSDRKRDYMMHHLEIVTTVSSILLTIDGSQQSLFKKVSLWRFIKERDAALYDMLRKRLMGRILHLPSRIGRGVAIIVYKLARMIVGFS
jgi:hypothetical protein